MFQKHLSPQHDRERVRLRSFSGGDETVLSAANSGSIVVGNLPKQPTCSPPSCPEQQPSPVYTGGTRHGAVGAKDAAAPGLGRNVVPQDEQSQKTTHRSVGIPTSASVPHSGHVTVLVAWILVIIENQRGNGDRYPAVLVASVKPPRRSSLNRTARRPQGLGRRRAQRPPPEATLREKGTSNTASGDRQSGIDTTWRSARLQTNGGMLNITGSAEEVRQAPRSY